MRQKNWLSNPISKQVSFQFEILKKTVNVRQLEVILEKKERKMGSNDKTKGRSFLKEKRSGITPFIYKPKGFTEDAKTQVIETTEGRNKLESKMNILNGDAAPEQLMI